MSVLVAIEASTDAGSIALGRGRTLLAEVMIGTRTRHAEALLPALDFALGATRTPRTAISGIVVGAGPGSFTGVRVAAAMARGLAHGLAVPLFAYSSLAALALEASGGTDAICALFDARRGEVYAACYRVEQGSDRLTELLAPVVLTIAALRAQLAAQEVQFVGEGALRYAAQLGSAGAGVRVPRASALLRLQSAQPAEGRVREAAGWEPAYLRASGAERGIAG
ncbi:MAG TPA: tRNA (adenosine(37)-N6)-threonylcarbamoyltransferase complex dimerization subunit type 1 TsaB [Longimicrobiales bacterium]|nr:tRNA (adenosine(37)-N6)-threonylcarbamoyltransferase complex dimerization subunit type 1 TsaB [Longimicrobiales bacterium]